jgi:hypothetical protein
MTGPASSCYTGGDFDDETSNLKGTAMNESILASLVQSPGMASMLQWLVIFLFGMAFGAAGQLVRAIGGVKKVSDEAQALHTTTGQLFDTGRFRQSLLIGGVAGVLAVLATVDMQKELTTQLVLGIMAAGYSGADFIEAFVRKQMPEMSPADVAARTGETPPAGTGTPLAAGTDAASDAALG